AMTWLSVVLPSPGGPKIRTWSSASPRCFAASMNRPICSRTGCWPRYSASRLGRMLASMASSSRVDPAAMMRCSSIPLWSHGAPVGCIGCSPLRACAGRRICRRAAPAACGCLLRAQARYHSLTRGWTPLWERPWSRMSPRLPCVRVSSEVRSMRRCGRHRLYALLDARHVGQPVRDALVAIDAGGFAGGQERAVRPGGAAGLAGQVHRVVVVAVAALQRVVGLEPDPLVGGQHQALVEELLAGVDGPEDLAPHPLGGLHLARDLVGPVVRHVAVGTGGAHAGTVAVVDGGLELLEYVVAHLVAAGTERLGVGGVHGGVESTPKQHPGQEPAQGQEAQAQ